MLVRYRVASRDGEMMRGVVGTDGHDADEPEATNSCLRRRVT